MRVIAKDPAALAATRLVLLETNPVLIEIQRKNLNAYSPQWITEIDQIDASNTPAIILANEFFDALPIKQFQFQNNNWHERLIGLKNVIITLGLSPTPLARSALPP
jgi:SAM-dependent MidA family methyltransferase